MSVKHVNYWLRDTDSVTSCLNNTLAHLTEVILQGRVRLGLVNCLKVIGLLSQLWREQSLW